MKPWVEKRQKALQVPRHSQVNILDIRCPKDPKHTLLFTRLMKDTDFWRLDLRWSVSCRNCEGGKSTIYYLTV